MMSTRSRKNQGVPLVTSWLRRVVKESYRSGRVNIRRRGEIEQLIWRGLGACITRMAPTRSPTRFACARSRPSQREGYIPQSPKVRFLGTVHPFGEYLPWFHRNSPSHRKLRRFDETFGGRVGAPATEIPSARRPASRVCPLATLATLARARGLSKVGGDQRELS